MIPSKLVNEVDFDVRKSFRQKIFEHYVWNEGQLCWIERKGKLAIGHVNVGNHLMVEGTT